LDAIRLHHLIGERERTIDARYSVMENDIGLLAHRAQDLAASQRRPDRIAVGASVRSQHEAAVLFDLPKDIREHVVMPSLHLASC
jgi:hypothetical protein